MKTAEDAGVAEDGKNLIGRTFFSALLLGTMTVRFFVSLIIPPASPASSAVFIAC